MAMSISVKVIIDHREGKIKELINPGKVPCPIEYENLEHGDIVIYHNEVPVFFFERKTLADLKASINDGRYRNQKLKMLEKFDKGMIYYIIEGDVIREEALKGAIINTMLRDKIGVFKTKDIHDTLQLIYDIVDRVHKDPQKYIHISPVEKELQQAVGNRNESMFVNMLCQIPHISLKTAKAVEQKYACFHDLHVALDDKTYDEKLKSLKDIMIVDPKGKSRKISTTACDNIIKGYYGENNAL
jgi:ERCC4-type nuclease